MICRRRIIFTGEVQGVGFRYYCRSYAARLGLTGFARNENGYPERVTVEAQGEKRAIEELISYLCGLHTAAVQDFHVQTLPLAEGETCFHIEDAGY